MKIIVPNTLKKYEDMIVSHSFTNDWVVPEWQQYNTYYQGNMAFFDGNLYRATEFNNEKQPDTYVDDFWSQLGAWDNVDGQEWVVDNDYALGDLVTLSDGYRNFIYKATEDNRGVKPTTANTSWLKIGAVNVYRCLYGATENKTENNGDFNITLKLNRSDYFYALGVNAHEGKIEIFDADGNIIKTVNESLQYKGATTWTEYYFKEFSYKNTFGTSLPLLFSGKVKASFLSNNATRVGDIIIGRSFFIGEALWGASNGILDFSKKERDENFGDVTLVQGSFAKRSSVTVSIDTLRSDAIMSFLTAIRGTDVLILADERDDGFDMLKIRGFVRDFTISLSSPVKSELTIELEGLI